MFERFTDRAQRVMVLAEEQARVHSHNYIGTEHILLGLIQEGDGVAVKALESLGISLEAVRQQVEEIIGRVSRSRGPDVYRLRRGPRRCWSCLRARHFSSATTASTPSTSCHPGVRYPPGGHRVAGAEPVRRRLPRLRTA
jgi:ATP-dependent Clp protease ATP-binding subunit ClpA